MSTHPSTSTPVRGLSMQQQDKEEQGDAVGGGGQHESKVYEGRDVASLGWTEGLGPTVEPRPVSSVVRTALGRSITGNRPGR